jgi:hypothetical protein
MAEQNPPVEEAIEKQAKSNAPLMIAAAIVIILGGLIAAVAYIAVNSSRVYIEKAAVEAPSIVLAPTTAGTLMAVYVNPGDTVAPNAVVARSWYPAHPRRLNRRSRYFNQPRNIGAQIAANAPVVTLIDQTQLSVIGHSR